MQDVTESLNSQVVDNIDGRDVTRAELHAAFDRVADKANWKKPVDAIVIITSAREWLLIESAIEFFTGSKAEREIVRLEAYCSTYRVRAKGYYAAIGA